MVGPFGIDEELRTELDRCARLCACELLHVEFHAGVLRLVIDHPEGVTLEHCESVSDQASLLLDSRDWGRGRYTLEVTSPGLDRRLYRPTDYERFVGRLVRVRYLDPETDRRATRRFRLAGLTNASGDWLVHLGELQEDSVKIFPLSRIEEARLAPDWPGSNRKKQKDDRGHAANTSHRRRAAR